MLLMLVISRRLSIIILFLGVFLAGLFFVPGAKERFLFVFQIGGDQGRYAMWKAAFQMIRESPFLGHGLGTYLKHLPSYAPQLGTMYAHNSYLQLWAEAGIFSLLGFLGFCAVLLFGSIRLFFKRAANVCLLGFLCAFFTFLTHAFLDNHLFSLQLSALFWLLAGLLNAQTQVLKLSGKKTL
jgi:O-antigen ligase